MCVREAIYATTVQKYNRVYVRFHTLVMCVVVVVHKDSEVIV